MRNRPQASTRARRISLGISGAIAAGLLIVPAASADITKPYQPKREKQLAPGIEFSKGVARTTGGRKQWVFVGITDASHPNVRFRALLSNHLVVNKERPTRLAKRKSRPTRKAMFVTNGDRSVFGANDGRAAPNSMHISNGELMVVQACSRPTLGIDSNGEARIGNVRVHLSARRIGLQMVKTIHRVNAERKGINTVLYTTRFGPRTLTKGGREVILELPQTLAPNDVQIMRVKKVRTTGNSRIRPGQAVLSVKASGNHWVKDLKVGQELEVTTTIVKRVDGRCGGTIEAAGGWDDIVEAMGGNYFTVRNNKNAAPARSVYPASTERHPRTNIGVTADGRIIQVVVDGRRRDSVGVTLKEMGQLMKSFGAVAAFNLDGGGSSVLAKRHDMTSKLRITNRPSDGRERVHSLGLAAFALKP